MNNKIRKGRNSQDKVWAHFQNNAPEVFDPAKPRLDFIVREINRRKGILLPHVLNIGVGSGYFEDTIQRLGWEIYSLDPDRTAITRLIEKGVNAQRGYIEQMSFDDASFNFVIASEVLEHLSDEQTQRGISEVARVLKPGGFFIGTVPYSENLLKNQVVCPKCGEVFHRWGHKKSFDMKTIRDELSSHLDVLVLKRRAFESFRGESLKVKLLKLARLIIAEYGAEMALPSVYFVAKKLP